VTAADIVSAVDGPIALTICIEQGDGACDVESLCPTRRGWRRINDAVRQALGSVTLAELAFPLPDAVMSCSVEDATQPHEPAQP